MPRVVARIQDAKSKADTKVKTRQSLSTLFDTLGSSLVFLANTTANLEELSPSTSPAR
jgi:hypothetical protein